MAQAPTQDVEMMEEAVAMVNVWGYYGLGGIDGADGAHLVCTDRTHALGKQEWVIHSNLWDTSRAQITAVEEAG